MFIQKMDIVNYTYIFQDNSWYERYYQEIRQENYQDIRKFKILNQDTRSTKLSMIQEYTSVMLNN